MHLIDYSISWKGKAGGNADTRGCRRVGALRTCDRNNWKRGYKLGHQRARMSMLKSFINWSWKVEAVNSSWLERLLMNALIEGVPVSDSNLWKISVTKSFQFLLRTDGFRKPVTKKFSLHTPNDYVTKRWNELLEQEAEIMKRMEVRGDWECINQLGWFTNDDFESATSKIVLPKLIRSFVFFSPEQDVVRSWR